MFDDNPNVPPPAILEAQTVGQQPSLTDFFAHLLVCHAQYYRSLLQGYHPRLQGGRAIQPPQVLLLGRDGEGDEFDVDEAPARVVFLALRIVVLGFRVERRGVWIAFLDDLHEWNRLSQCSRESKIFGFGS